MILVLFSIILTRITIQKLKLGDLVVFLLSLRSFRCMCQFVVQFVIYVESSFLKIGLEVMLELGCRFVANLVI